MATWAKRVKMADPWFTSVRLGWGDGLYALLICLFGVQVTPTITERDILSLYLQNLNSSAILGVTGNWDHSVLLKPQLKGKYDYDLAGEEYTLLLIMDWLLNIVL